MRCLPLSLICLSVPLLIVTACEEPTQVLSDAEARISIVGVDYSIDLTEER